MKHPLNIGICHPGAMGMTVGQCATSAGHIVGWNSVARSERTRQRAKSAAFREFTNLQSMTEFADVIISICPPENALDIASDIASVGFNGTYLDANAISPMRAHAVMDVINRAGANYVDGGLIGPPVQEAGSTRLYISGSHARQIENLFAGTALEVISLGDDDVAASTMKMCYSAWSKGSIALLIAVAALAKKSNTLQALMDEWAMSQPFAPRQLDAVAIPNIHKSWRFAGEMNEIADTFEVNDLPTDFHAGAAKIYDALRDFKDATEHPDLDDVLMKLIKTPAK